MKDGVVLCEALQEAARRRKAGAPNDADQILVFTREAMDDRLAGDTDNFDCSRAARELAREHVDASRPVGANPGSTWKFGRTALHARAATGRSLYWKRPDEA